MDGRARDAYHPWKIIMCCQGRKWMSRLTKDFGVLSLRTFFFFFPPDFINSKLLLKSVTFLMFCPFPNSLFSPNIYLSVSWIFLRVHPPPLEIHPFSLHLGVWLPKQMGLRGEEKTQSKTTTQTVLHTITSSPNSRSRSSRGNTHR